MRRDGGSVFPAHANTGDPDGPVEACSANERADIHDGPEHDTLQSEAGYIDARPLTAISTKSLATHGRTIHVGHLRRFRRARATSAIAPTVTKMLSRSERRKGPLSAARTRSKNSNPFA